MRQRVKTKRAVVLALKGAGIAARISRRVVYTAFATVRDARVSGAADKSPEKG